MKLHTLISCGALAFALAAPAGAAAHAAVNTDPDDASCITAEKQFASDIGGCLGYADTAQALADCNAAIVEWISPSGGVQACVLAEINEINSQQKK